MSSTTKTDPKLSIETESYSFEDLCLDGDTHTRITIVSTSPSSGNRLYEASAVRFHSCAMYELEAFPESFDDNDDSVTIFESIFEDHPCSPLWFKPNYRKFKSWYEVIQHRMLVRFEIELPSRDVDIIHLYDLDITKEGREFGIDEISVAKALVSIASSEMPKATPDGLVFVIPDDIKPDSSNCYTSDLEALGWCSPVSMNPPSPVMKHLGCRMGSVLAKYINN